VIITLNITEDHLKLIPLFLIKDDNVEVNHLDGNEEHDSVRIDKDHLYCLGFHLLDDMAMALGLEDKAIKGTEESSDGRAFPDDVEEYLLSTHKYIVDNLYYIEMLIHQFVVKGGITAGTYKAKDNDLIFEKV
jgi:hypothetical protein